MNAINSTPRMVNTIGTPSWMERMPGQDTADTKIRADEQEHIKPWIWAVMLTAALVFGLGLYLAVTFIGSVTKPSPPIITPIDIPGPGPRSSVIIHTIHSNNYGDLTNVSMVSNMAGRMKDRGDDGYGALAAQATLYAMQPCNLLKANSNISEAASNCPRKEENDVSKINQTMGETRLDRLDTAGRD